MKCFLWAMNYVPVWIFFCGRSIMSLSICWLPVFSLYLQSPSVWGQCRIVSLLRWRALSSVMPLSLFPCFGWMRIYALLTMYAVSVLSCNAPTSRFDKQGSWFPFCVIHTCMFQDGCWIPSPSQIHGVCVRDLHSSCSGEGEWCWWDAAEVCWVNDTERDHSLLQAKSEAWSNMLTTWLGDRYMLVFVPALRFYWIHIQCWL